MALGIKEIEPGKWRIRVQPVNPATGKRVSKEKTVDAANAREATRLRAVFETEIMDALRSGFSAHAARSSSTFDEYLDHWLNHPSHTRRDHVSENDGITVKVFLRPLLGALLLTGITKAHVLTWQATVQTMTMRPKKAAPPEPYARQTLLKAWRLLRGAIRSAVADGWITEDITHLMRFSPHGKVPKRRESLTVDEQTALLLAMKTEPLDWQVMTLMFLTTGARFGEISALTWDDMDLDRGVFDIVKSQVAGDVNIPKTGRARLNNYLAPDIVEGLKALKALQEVEKYDGDLVFPSIKGTYRRAAAFFKFINRVGAKISLGRKIGSHTFRRTFNTEAQQVASQAVVMAMMGHSTEGMFRHYTTTSADLKRNAVDKAFGPVLDASKIN